MLPSDSGKLVWWSPAGEKLCEFTVGSADYIVRLDWSVSSHALWMCGFSTLSYLQVKRNDEGRLRSALLAFSLPSPFLILASFPSSSSLSLLLFLLLFLSPPLPPSSSPSFSSPFLLSLSLLFPSYLLLSLSLLPTYFSLLIFFFPSSSSSSSSSKGLVISVSPSHTLHFYDITCCGVAFSPSGRSLASGDLGGNVAITQKDNVMPIHKCSVSLPVNVSIINNDSHVICNCLVLIIWLRAHCPHCRSLP